MKGEKSPQVSAMPVLFAGIILIIFNIISVLRILENTKDSGIKDTIFEEILMNMIIDHFTMIILGFGLIVFASSVSVFAKKSTENMGSIVKGNRQITKPNLPNPSLKGRMDDGFEWLEHGNNHYYRPENQPNSEWQIWQG